MKSDFTSTKQDLEEDMINNIKESNTFLWSSLDLLIFRLALMIGLINYEICLHYSVLRNFTLSRNIQTQKKKSQKILIEETINS